MIAPPVNDHDCLEPITEVVRQVVDRQDPGVLELVQQYPSPAALAEYIRNLPQRDDEGDPTDGPKVRACRPPQRLRIPADDPNCVERSALYIAAAELIDPRPVRQLVTVDTPWGLHTMPVEQNDPVVLDPKLPRNALCGALFALYPSAFPMTVRDAVDWIATVAAEPASRRLGGFERIQSAHSGMHKILDGHLVSERAIDDIAYTASLARVEAHRWGSRGRELVEETIRMLRERIPRPASSSVALARCYQPAPLEPDLADLRNLSIRIGGLTLKPDTKLLGALAKVGLRIGTQAAVPALAAKVGLPLAALQVLEGELNKEGASLGPLLGPVAKPLFPSLATLPKALRNASPPAPMVTLEFGRRNIATPQETRNEMRITDMDIKALAADIYAAFRRPFEAQLAQAEARFEAELGRAPGLGIPGKGPGDPGIGYASRKTCDHPRDPKYPDVPICKHVRVTLTAGVNDVVSGEEDYAKVYSMMSPVPKPDDIQWKTYEGTFVHSFGEFTKEWDRFVIDNGGWTSRLPGTGAYDQTLDFRRRAQAWREKFLALGGTATTPGPAMPVKSPGVLDNLNKGVKTGLWALGGVLAAALVVPPLLRRSAT